MVRVKAVILAGGEGSRLRPLTYYFQKCMIPIGPSQKPLLEYILLHIKSSKITREAVILVGYKAEQIINYFKDGKPVGMSITYVHDSEELKGTGGSLLNAYLSNAVSEEDNLLIYYGDIISNIDLREMLNQHTSGEADVTLAVSPTYQVPVGVVKLDGKRVYGIEEKPILNIPVTIGILLMKGNMLPLIKELYKPGEKRGIDIMADILPFLIGKGCKVQAYVTDAFWYDIGSTERYEKLTNEMVTLHMGFLESVADS